MFQNLLFDEFKRIFFRKGFQSFPVLKHDSASGSARETEIGIRSLTGTVHDTAHHGDFAQMDPASGCLQILHERKYFIRKMFQIDFRSSAGGTRDEFRFGSAKTG